MSTRRLVSATTANLVVPLSGLLVGPVLSRELGPEGRGFYAALTLPVVVYGWLGTYGLQDALTFHLRHRRLSGRDAARVALLATVPLGLLGVLLLAVLGLVALAREPGEHRQFLVLALLAPLHILANLLVGALTGVADVGGVNLLKVVPAVIRTVLLVGACLAFDLSAFVAGLLFLVSAAGGTAVGLRRLRRAPAGEVPSGPLPLRSLTRYAAVCLPGVLAAVATARLDQVIGLPLLGARELGFYAVAVSVAELPMVVATAARTVLMGRADGDDPAAALRVARLALPLTLAACVVLAAVAAPLLPLVFGEAFAPAVLPTVVLCAATVLYTGVQILGAVLLANGRAGRSSAALVAGALTGVVALVALAPLGAVGAAVASLLGYAVAVLPAARSVVGLPGVPSLRAVTVPYADDLRFLRARLRQRGRRSGPAPVDTGSGAR
ncbi:oligosaccharide flippase family protein [Micromonospora sp. NPDC050187]|uniref:oligosaccharide flippase family protein n=1 Tax=Micromonospora sp. NPDC050187 TaxID=3364277 RepID=UPI0037A2A78B